MITFLNIALVIVASAATLAAFGGDTWEKSKKREPFLKRINTRGWISLFCLLLTLVFGVMKEIESERQDAEKDKDAVSDKIIADKDRQFLKAQLTESQKDLNGAKDQLQTVRGDLNKTQTTLGSVQDDLRSARADLGKQNTSNLITTLSSSKRQVTEIWLTLPMFDVGEYRVRDVRTALLFGLFQPDCAASVLDVTENLAVDTNTSFVVDHYQDPVVPTPIPTPDNADGNTIHEKFALIGDTGISWWESTSHIKIKSSNGFAQLIRFVPERPLFVATFLSFILNNPSVFSISIGGDKCISGARLKGVKASAFGDGVLLLILDGDVDETISFALRAQPLRVNDCPADYGCSIGVNYVTISEPIILTVPRKYLEGDFGGDLDRPEYAVSGYVKYNY
ncbi:MAG: hypothetical protein WBE72_19550 [Terracidiphilus sp.]